MQNKSKPLPPGTYTATFENITILDNKAHIAKIEFSANVPRYDPVKLHLAVKKRKKRR